MKAKLSNRSNHKFRLLFKVVMLLAICFAVATASRGASTFRVQVFGNGAPLIFIPGLSSSGDVWKSTVVHYQDHYQCHVLTLAGFAGVPPVQDDAFLDHVKNDLAEYIKENHLQKPILIGHSLGAFLALWLASEEPGLVGKIVVVDALPYLPAATYPSMTPQVAYPFASKMKERLLAQPDDEYRMSQKLTFRSLITDTSTADAASAWGITSDKATVAECIYEMQTIDLRQQLYRITVPALVFATWIGNKPYQTHDGIAEVFKAQYYLLKNYKLVVNDNARHFVMLDDPQGFFQEIDVFLSEN